MVIKIKGMIEFYQEMIIIKYIYMITMITIKKIEEDTNSKTPKTIIMTEIITEIILGIIIVMIMEEIEVSMTEIIMDLIMGTTMDTLMD